MVLVLPIAATFVVWAHHRLGALANSSPVVFALQQLPAQVANWVEANGNVRPAFAAWPVITRDVCWARNPSFWSRAGIAVAIGVFRKPLPYLTYSFRSSRWAGFWRFAAYGQHAPTTFSSSVLHHGDPARHLYRHPLLDAIRRFQCIRRTRRIGMALFAHRYSLRCP